ncbi:MAG: biopolymer transporter ExbD [Planctomycetes bacterium]|nr:biopolymer transporter ExbD [Planctomycetota bacterium]
MSSKAAKQMAGSAGEMDMTPMIDIVFNLLIFFLVVSDLNKKDLAELTLPLAYMALEDKGDDPDDRLILNVDKQGQVLFRGDVKNLDELGTILNQAVRLYNIKKKGDGMAEVAPGAKASKLFVLLRADKDTPWQHVQWIMTIMAEEKLYKCQFATSKFIGGGYGGEEGQKEARMIGGITQDEFKGQSGEGGQ